MVFSSHLFIFFFLPLALAAYYVSPLRLKHLTLTLFSYLFYGWANPLFALLLLFSTTVDYLVGLGLTRGLPREVTGERALLPHGEPRTRGQRWLIFASVATNLGLLGFFKYFNFGVESYTAAVRALGFDAPGVDAALRVTLPLGISFYTFQAMSYTIDVYRGRTRAIDSYIDFACFVSMFPQLVAGPIVRFADIAEQLRRRDHTAAKFARGVALFSIGLTKKVLVANPCGKVADLAFDASSVGMLDAWYGAVAYAFQIYFDFSAYSDMAIGMGLMFGFAFLKNFDSPYRSESITEFWRRWHISLSTFLRDYLYTPLGGNRRGARRTYLNLAIVMLLGGLWHGAAWTFVVWGGLHGALLAVERMRGKRPLYASWPRAARVAATFLIVTLAWVFFRAPDLATAVRYLGSMAGLQTLAPGAGLIAGVIYQPYYVMTFIAAGIVTWTCPQTWEWSQTLTTRKAVAAGIAFAAALAVLSTQAYNPFIYFIF